MEAGFQHAFMGLLLFATAMRELESAPNERISHQSSPGYIPISYCYYQNGAPNNPPPYNFSASAIAPDVCTHVAYAFATFHNNFTVTAHDEEAFSALRKLKATAGVKLMMTVGGWGQGSAIFSKMAATYETRQMFIGSSLYLIRKIQFDGIDIDWEYPANGNGSSPKDKEHFVQLLLEFKERMYAGEILAVAVGAKQENCEPAYDVQGIYKYADLVSLMAYDLYQHSYLSYGAPLFSNPDLPGYQSVSSAWIWFKDRGAVAYRTLIGFPFYGRSYRTIDSAHVAVGDPVVKGMDSTLVSYQICHYLQNSSAVSMYNSTQVTSVMLLDRLWVSYDEDKSIAEKVHWLIGEQLRGAMVWSIDIDLQCRYTVCPNVTRDFQYLRLIRDILKGHTSSDNTAPLHGDRRPQVIVNRTLSQSPSLQSHFRKSQKVSERCYPSYLSLKP